MRDNVSMGPTAIMYYKILSDRCPRHIRNLQKVFLFVYMYVKGKIVRKRQCGTFQNFVYLVTRYKKGWELAPYHFCLLLTHTNKHAKAFYNRTLNKKIHISMSRTDAWYKTEEIAPLASRI